MYTYNIYIYIIYIYIYIYIYTHTQIYIHLHIHTHTHTHTYTHTHTHTHTRTFGSWLQQRSRAMRPTRRILWCVSSLSRCATFCSAWQCWGRTRLQLLPRCRCSRILLSPLLIALRCSACCSMLQCVLQMLMLQDLVPTTFDRTGV